MKYSDMKFDKAVEYYEKLLKGKRRYIFISAIIPGIMFIVGGLAKSWLLFVPAITILASFGLSRRTLFSSYLNKFIPSNKRATVLSTISMLETLVIAITYPIVGRLAEWSLNYTFIILGVSVILFSLVSRVEESMLID